MKIHNKKITEQSAKCEKQCNDNNCNKKKITTKKTCCCTFLCKEYRPNLKCSKLVLTRPKLSNT